MRQLAVPLLALFAMTLSAQPAAKPIQYTLRFAEAQNHYVDIEATYPVSGDSLDLFMAVWTPGSYLVREYARNVEAVTAVNPSGQTLDVTKSAKNRWHIAGLRGASTVNVRYRVYSREMSVRTNWVEAGFAILNGAPTFLWPVGDLKRPAEITLDLPASWQKSISPLPSPNSRAHHFLAPDYDTLVDSPIYAGNAATYDFDVDGKPHVLVNEGESGMWNGAKAAQDVKTLVSTAHRLWGVVPYDRYVFFNMITEANGGLEHKSSTTLMTSRYVGKSKTMYQGGFEGEEWRDGWLALVSHEFFHLWNVKRLRPIELGPFKYEEENYTPLLWVAEGFTSYYGDLLVARAGFWSPTDYLHSLGGQINALQTNPGRLVQPLELSSYDAWIKYYRPDENSKNVTVGYYNKGQVVGFLLDAKIRQATNGAKNLDDLMRLLYTRFSGPHGYTSTDFRKAASELAGTDLTAWLHDALDTTKELDYQPALAYYGLRFKPATGPDRASLGVTTKPVNDRHVISAVTRATTAYAAGLNVDDEIVAIDGFRVVGADALRRKLRLYRPGEKIQLTVARREKLQTFDLTLDTEAKPLALELDPAATPEQQSHYAALLRP